MNIEEMLCTTFEFEIDECLQREKLEDVIVFKGTYKSFPTVCKIFDEKYEALPRYVKEIAILSELKGLYRTPTLINNTIISHNFRNRGIIFKEYLPGETMVTSQQQFTASKIKEIRKLIGKIHQRGIARFDIHLDNILVSYNGELRFFDFDKATLRTETSPAQWEEAKKADYHCVHNAFLDKKRLQTTYE